MITESYAKYNFLDDNTGLIEAACEPKRTVMGTMPSNNHTKSIHGTYNGHSPIPKAHQNGNGFKSSNGSLNGIYTNANGVYVDGSC